MRFQIQTIMLLIVILALVAALGVQHFHAAQREASLTAQVRDQLQISLQELAVAQAHAAQALASERVARTQAEIARALLDQSQSPLKLDPTAKESGEQKPNP
jgi:cell division protein FtsL